MKICKNCKYWDIADHEKVTNLGRCTRAKMIWDVTEWNEELEETTGFVYSRILKEDFKDEKHFVTDGI